MISHRPLLAGLACGALAACNLAPAYRQPAPVPGGAALPASFKADPGWAVAQPADDIAKGAWWRLFGDPVLDGLEARVAVNNQNVAAERAAWAQARALVAESRAALFPSAGISASAARSGTFGNRGPANTGSTYSAGASASWAPDLWGRLGNSLAATRAQAEATAADYANATLSAQASLAADYVSLRAIDAEIAVLDASLAAEERALTVTRNQYAAGVVARSEVDAAEQTFASTRAARRDLDRVRAAGENAIATLIGENPSSFRLAADPAWTARVPDVPAVIPARLLERRPDIAAAERTVAAANAGIGQARAAFFPTVNLTGSASSSAGTVSALFGAATSLWSLGASAAETLIDFGARSAGVRAARAVYDQAVANYRQTVLSAFQSVETTLAARAAYADEARDAETAAAAAERTAVVAHNAFAAGTTDAATLASAIAAAASARQQAIETTLNRQLAAIDLIEGIGGEWSDAVPGPTAGPLPAAH